MKSKYAWHVDTLVVFGLNQNTWPSYASYFVQSEDLLHCGWAENDDVLELKKSTFFLLSGPTLRNSSNFQIYSDCLNGSIKPDMYFGVDVDFVAPTSQNEAECICSGHDIMNFGCPSARGKKCRSKC